MIDTSKNTEPILMFLIRFHNKKAIDCKKTIPQRIATVIPMINSNTSPVP